MIFLAAGTYAICKPGCAKEYLTSVGSNVRYLFLDAEEERDGKGFIFWKGL